MPGAARQAADEARATTPGRRSTDVALRSPESLTLEQVADVTGMTPRNVRAYQQRNLLPPVRRSGRRLVYGQAHVARLRIVRGLHEHGLTLKVIADLVERGTADHELARLGRQDLTTVWQRGVRVPLHPENVTLFERDRPGTLQEMEAAGLISWEGGRPHASAISLGLVSALSARGIDLDQSARLVLLAARGAHTVVEALGAELSTLENGPHHDETRQLMAQLVVTAFADVLAERLVR